MGHFCRVIPGGIEPSEMEKPDILRTQFQPVTDPSFPGVTVLVDVVLIPYFLTPASETKLTSHNEVQETIIVPNISKNPAPNSIPVMAFKYLPH